MAERRKYHKAALTPREISERLDELTSEALAKGKPDRETVINKDDVLNVKIALESAKSIDEFLSLL